MVDNSLSGERVSRELDKIGLTRGYPCMIVSDNGTELTSNAILKWQQERLIEWHYIAPGKPMQNGFVESFNAAFATNALTSMCSPATATQNTSLKHGGTTTITTGPTPASTGLRQSNLQTGPNWTKT